MSRRALGEKLGVSCETLDRLDIYVDMLLKWSRAINLLGPTDADEIWHRHLLDSAQLVRAVPDTAESWLDLGSGAGLPGLVCAACTIDHRPELHFELVDSDQRKAAFLREAARQMKLSVTVHAKRCEELAPRPFDIVTARALAPLPRLLRLALPFADQNTTFLLHKGRGVDAELTAARQDWHMDCDLLPSLSDPAGTILKISGLQPMP